jgi:hypothetical protein
VSATYLKQKFGFEDEEEHRIAEEKSARVRSLFFQEMDI